MTRVRRDLSQGFSNIFTEEEAMNLTREDRDCLIAYSRKPENLCLALAVGAIQVDLRIAIITEFLEELREYVKAGLERQELPWCIPPVQLKERDFKAKGWVPMLSIKRKEPKREIILYKGEDAKKTYLGGKCDGEPVLEREVLETALVGVGTGGRYNTADGFEWWRNMGQEYCDFRALLHERFLFLYGLVENRQVPQ